MRGYTSSLNDYSLFFKSFGSLITLVAVYVDDILLTGNNQQEIDELKVFLDVEFKIKDLGIANYFLGMDILYNSVGVLVTQRKFALDLISEYQEMGTRSASTSLDPTIKLTVESGSLLPNPTIYRLLLGQLNYLTHTRPDLSYTVRTMSQFMQTPRSVHLKAAYHTLPLPYKSLGFAMPTGQIVQTPDALLVVFTSVLEAVQFHGNLKNK